MAKKETIDEEQPNYKKKYYILVRRFCQLESLFNRRCPLAHHCCGACSIVKSKAKRLKIESNIKDFELDYYNKEDEPN